VRRRARGLTRTAKGSLELRVSNKDSCVPCGFIAANDTRLAMQGTAPRDIPQEAGACLKFYGLDNDAS
jgi:hypothetical protein